MNNNKIPTAEEVFRDIQKGNLSWTKDLKMVGIETAKRLSRLHVKAALEAAAEKAEIVDEGCIGGNGEWIAYDVINKESILNSYPLTKIK